MVCAADIFYAKRLIEKVKARKNEVNFVKMGKLRDLKMQALKLGPIIFGNRGQVILLGSNKDNRVNQNLPPSNQKMQKPQKLYFSNCMVAN